MRVILSRGGRHRLRERTSGRHAASVLHAMPIQRPHRRWGGVWLVCVVWWCNAAFIEYARRRRGCRCCVPSQSIGATNYPARIREYPIGCPRHHSNGHMRVKGTPRPFQRQRDGCMLIPETRASGAPATNRHTPSCPRPAPEVVCCSGATPLKETHAAGVARPVGASAAVHRPGTGRQARRLQ